MAADPVTEIAPTARPFRRRRSDVLQDLVTTTMALVAEQFAGFSARLSQALLDQSELGVDSRVANHHFNLANLLRNNGYPFQHLAQDALEQTLLREIALLEHGAERSVSRRASDMTLVPYAEMDNKVLLGTSARLFDIEQADALAALNSRLAGLLQRDAVSVAQNPFRPEIFLAAIHAAWCEFTPEAETHALILPLLRPTIFLELAPILEALNAALIGQGILPELVPSYQIRKSAGNLSAATREASQQALRQQLRERFDGPEQTSVGATGHATGHVSSTSPGHAASPSLLGRVNLMPADETGGNELDRLKAGLPPGTMSRVDETTIDLLSQVFETVFQDPHIPPEIKELIGYLQIPVLKAALLDQEFFYSEAHPARQFIELMARASIGWDRSKGLDDPLYRTMKQGVDRVRHVAGKGDQETDASAADDRFAQALGELETYVSNEERAATTALAAPITQALHVEKIRTANRSARNDVAVRVRTGEVAAFVEAFLESRWIPVLTLAHSIHDEKPEVLTSAIKTMDELLWSLQPKLTADHRRALINRLPTILSMLNKWLNVIKWDDAERLQFFAELAECHASIVRAPIDLSPERQVEIAVDVARKAAEHRLDIKAREPVEPEPEQDQYSGTVERLQRGAWLAFMQPAGTPKQVRLAWVSPLRTLYIFTNGQREEAFSMSADELAVQFRDHAVSIMASDGMVERALVRALETAQVSADDNA